MGIQVITGKEVRWASRSRVNDHLEFIELRGCTLEVAYFQHAYFEVSNVLVKMTRFLTITRGTRRLMKPFSRTAPVWLPAYAMNPVLLLGSSVEGVGGLEVNADLQPASKRLKTMLDHESQSGNGSSGPSLAAIPGQGRLWRTQERLAKAICGI